MLMPSVFGRNVTLTFGKVSDCIYLWNECFFCFLFRPVYQQWTCLGGWIYKMGSWM